MYPCVRASPVCSQYVHVCACFACMQSVCTRVCVLRLCAVSMYTCVRASPVCRRYVRVCACFACMRSVCSCVCVLRLYAVSMYTMLRAGLVGREERGMCDCCVSGYVKVILHNRGPKARGCVNRVETDNE